jgi:hypothetical protein
LSNTIIAITKAAVINMRTKILLFIILFVFQSFKN